MLRLRRYSLLALVLLALQALSSGDSLDDDHRLSMEFETPHVDWGTPFALGKVQVLFFVTGRGTAPREAVELMQRFDMGVEAAYWEPIVDTQDSQWLGGEQGIQRISRLMAEEWDAFVFFDLPLSSLTEEQQAQLLSKVHQGAGVVSVGPGDERFFPPDGKAEDLPAGLRQAEGVKGYRVEGGRSIQLPARPDIPFDLGWEARYESWQQLFGTAILWAAGRDGEVALEIALAKDGFDREELPGQMVKISWQGPEKRKILLEPWIRGLNGDRIPLPTYARKAGSGSISMGLPVLPEGQYFVDVIASSGRGKESWLSKPFSVSSSKKISDIALDKTWAEVGEVLSGKVVLEGGLSREEDLEVALCDRRNRVLAKQSVASAASFAFKFPVSDWMPMLIRVQATLLKEGQAVHRMHKTFHVTQRHRDQFNFLVWDYPKGTLAPYMEESLARLGTTLHLAPDNPPDIVAAYDIAWVPYTTRILAPLNDQAQMIPFCWNDPKQAPALVKTLAGQYAPSRAHGVFVYSLGDETVTRGSCVCAYCLKAYRAYLKAEYGDIAALNASWDGKYKSFDQVALLKPTDNDEGAAKEQKVYPRWYDRQAFQCFNFVQYCQKFAEAYKKMDPQARTGFEGAGSFNRGDDLDLIVRQNGFWTPYPGIGDEVLRSIAPRDFPRSNWIGYKKEADPLIAAYWRTVTRGCDSIWWWRWDCIGRFNGFLAPHGGPWPATQALVEDTRVVREGLGDLLIHSSMKDSDIAMLYSHPSCYAVTLEDGPSFGSMEDAHQAWHETLRDQGLSFRYVTDRQLRQGEWDPKSAQVMILSRAEAIGPKEAQVLTDFVAQGGTLVADLRPGLYDGHCKKLQKGALDPLFSDAEEAAGVDKKGKAVLFDVDPRSSPDFPNRVAETLTKAGVQAPYPIEGISGQAMKNVETVVWQDGELTLVALFREEGVEENGVVTLPHSSFVSDLRQGTVKGPISRVKVDLVPGRATFLVLSPSSFPAVRMSLSSSSARVGDILSLTLSVPEAKGLHAFSINALMPDQRQADWPKRIVLVGQEEKSVPIPIAWNDPCGRWEIKAKDLFTGQESSVHFEVSREDG